MRQGDIVILEFPFSNMAEKKQRPAVVLSGARYNRHANVLLAGIYGRKQPFSITITNADMRRKRLRKASYISLQNIFSADKTLIKQTADALTARKLAEVLAEVRECF
ncbi:MAG: type II toxin-antitoxin system PemK/MazF family toxin [bacterium]|nr:type II toxin-antitoxin system PemK/MazF family toxin [bacterium]